MIPTLSQTNSEGPTLANELAPAHMCGPSVIVLPTLPSLSLARAECYKILNDDLPLVVKIPEVSLRKLWNLSE